MIFRFIKIFENFQNGRGIQIFWFLETSMEVDYKIPKSTNYKFRVYNNCVNNEKIFQVHVRTYVRLLDPTEYGTLCAYNLLLNSN